MTLGIKTLRVEVTKPCSIKPILRFDLDSFKNDKKGYSATQNMSAEIVRFHYTDLCSSISYHRRRYGLLVAACSLHSPGLLLSALRSTALAALSP
jgi:hypothetical protein